ncbi:MAG: hypothetical protein R3246_15970, partial [Acidimicrobiia bacterium]|nr:hypothetical protein [Acidimicrobiia bacterium]
MPTRRQFLRTTALGGAAMYFNVFGAWGSAFAVPLAAGLSDPALQPKFANPVPNALDPGFIYRNNGRNQKYTIDIRPGVAMTGLLGTNGQPVPTPIFGYGEKGQTTWPGKTFEVVQ